MNGYARVVMRHDDQVKVAEGTPKLVPYDITS